MKPKLQPIREHPQPGRKNWIMGLTHNSNQDARKPRSEHLGPAPPKVEPVDSEADEEQQTGGRVAGFPAKQLRSTQNMAEKIT
jgi:hypothetical protein